VVLAAAAAGLGAAELYRALHDGRAFATRTPGGSVLTSDTVYIARVYDDLFRDGYPLSGWRFAAAGHWFPDLTLYCAVRPLTGPGPAAFVGFAAGQFLLTCAAAWLLARAVVPADRRWLAGVVLPAAASVVLLYNAKHFAAEEVLVTPLRACLHGGAIPCVLAAAGLAYRLATGAGGRWTGAGLAGLLALGCASDRIVVVWFAVPMTAAVGLVWVLGLRSVEPPVRGRGAAAAAAAVAAGCAAGWAVYRLVVPPEVDVLGAYYPDSARLATATRNLGRGLGGGVAGGHFAYLVAAAAAVLAAAVLGRTVLRFVVRPVPPAPSGLDLLAAYYLAVIAAGIPAVVAAGLTDDRRPWPVPARYLAPVFMLPLFGAAAVLPLTAGGPRARAAVCLAAVIGPAVLLAVVRGRPVGHDHGVAHFYPPAARKLDELAGKYGLKYGLGGHWEAHYDTVLSRRGVVVHPVAPCDYTPWGFTPWPYALANRAWFLGTPDIPAPDYAFVVLGPDLADRRGRIEAAFGPPAEVAEVGGQTILVYPPPSRLADVARKDFTLRNLFPPTVPGEVLRYPARTLPPVVGQGEPDGSRPAVPGRTNEGVVLSGPHLRLAPGAYRVGLVYDAPADGAGAWQVSLVRHDDTGDEVQHRGPLPAGPAAAVDVTVPADGRRRNLVVTVTYAGRVPLTLRELTVEKVR
jgi:hypothetical protein